MTIPISIARYRMAHMWTEFLLIKIEFFLLLLNDYYRSDYLKIYYYNTVLISRNMAHKIFYEYRYLF